MTWVIWRQYRVTAAIAGAILAAFAVLLLIAGLHDAAQWHTALANCAKNGTCGDLSQTVSLVGGPVYTLTTPHPGRSAPGRDTAPTAAERPGASHSSLRVHVPCHRLSYSSWRRHHMPVSLRPSGARSSHWYMPQRPSSPRAYAE